MAGGFLFLTANVFGGGIAVPEARAARTGLPAGAALLIGVGVGPPRAVRALQPFPGDEQLLRDGANGGSARRAPVAGKVDSRGRKPRGRPVSRIIPRTRWS